MKVKFSSIIKDLEGKPLRKNERDLSLSTVCVDALLSGDPKDSRGVEGKEKVVRYELAKRIHKGGCVDLTTDEIAKIKKLVGIMYFPIVVGQAFEMLENKIDEVDKETPSSEEEEKV